MNPLRDRCAGHPLRTAVVCVTLLLSLTAVHAQFGPKSLCGTNDKQWFEAAIADGAGVIAVCSTPVADDPVGAIRVLRLTRQADSSAQSQPVVIAQAMGAEREKLFTIKRYTRPQTTYLKFEFGNKQVTSIIYDAYDNGETSTSLKDTPVGAATAPIETELVPVTESLSLMGLESVVRTLPFDE